MNPISFKTWLDQFKNENTPIGDLSRDVNLDPEFPSTSTSKQEILGHLDRQGASPEAIQTFEKAWDLYLTSR